MIIRWLCVEELYLAIVPVARQRAQENQGWIQKSRHFGTTVVNPILRGRNPCSISSPILLTIHVCYIFSCYHPITLNQSLMRKRLHLA